MLTSRPSVPRYSGLLVPNYPAILNPIGTPGSDSGPCLESCGHFLCATAHDRATRYRCVYCTAAVGYVEPYELVRVGHYAHVRCRVKHRRELGVEAFERELYDALRRLGRAIHAESMRDAILEAGYEREPGQDIRVYGPQRAEFDASGACTTCGKTNGDCLAYHIHEDAWTERKAG